jgi:hypothetical protein
MYEFDLNFLEATNSSSISFEEHCIDRSTSILNSELRNYCASLSALQLASDDSCTRAKIIGNLIDAYALYPSFIQVIYINHFSPLLFFMSFIALKVRNCFKCNGLVVEGVNVWSIHYICLQHYIPKVC